MTEHSSDIMVSIVCDAYNYEKYIADALEGFLMQKTNYVTAHPSKSTAKKNK